MHSEKRTYQELALETGFSVATISRVFTDSSGVRDETRRELLEKLERLGYDPAGFSVRRKKQSGGLLLFNLPSFANPFYAEIIEGAKAAAVQRGYQMLVNEEHINDSTISRFMDLLRKTGAAGLVLTNHVSAELLKKIRDAVPLVQCCEYDKSLDLPFVSIDDKASAKRAMDYLFSLGKKRIAFINGPARYKYSGERLEGYLEALEAAGIERDPRLIINLPEISYNLAVSAVINLFNELLNEGKLPEVFFCVSDVFAAAVLKAAGRLGIQVPEEVMVIGFDNVDISAMTSPSITTISQPKYQIGFSACELLVESMNNKKSPVRHIFYETELIVRESTARETLIKSGFTTRPHTEDTEAQREEE
jgi:LacI family repressor for deo operon, udp, cdd, tsx, nupC, and nupG